MFVFYQVQYSTEQYSIEQNEREYVYVEGV